MLKLNRYRYLSCLARLFLSSVMLSIPCSFVYAEQTPKPLNQWQDSKYLLKAFNEIALKNEYQKTNQRILKWQRPIRYQFEYHHLKTNLLVENLFNTHLKHLSEITHHSILPVNKTIPNLVIHLTEDEEYANVIKRFTGSTVKNIERNSHCMGSFKTNQHNEIIQAQIVLPLDHVFSRGLLVACVVEETTQIMGLPNDSDWVNPSIANDASKVELLTGLDYILLKLLYDTNLKAGMDLKQSQPILKRKIIQLKASNEINRANNKVNASGLYLLVN